MGFYRSLTPKRHIGWSNSWTISLLDVGRLSRKRAMRFGLHLAKSARSYVKNGKKQYQGTSLLRQTGLFVSILEHFLDLCFNSVFGICVVFLIFLLLHQVWVALLRTYPPAFGRKLARLHRLFCKRKSMISASITTEVPIESWFESLAWDDMWDDANMYAVLAWLRGQMSLDLGKWRAAFPRKI